MSDQQESNSHIVPTCAIIGAISGYLLQGAMEIWVVMQYGRPGLFEMMAMFVIAIAVAIAGAVGGSVLGLFVKALLAMTRSE